MNNFLKTITENNKIFLSKSFCLLTIILVVLLFSNCVYSQQFGFRLHVPFSTFSGDALANTKYKPIININCISFQYYTYERSFAGFTEFGLSAIGTKQDYNGETYKADLFGIYVGFFLKYNIFKPEQTPYIYTGINLNLNFANELNLAVKNDNGITVTDIDHKIFLPLLSFGVGYTFLPGNFCIDLRDNIALTSVSPDYSVNCNEISIGIVYKR
jgi:hypothetical protein